jgi:HD-like signal output (HDOD) protein
MVLVLADPECFRRADAMSFQEEWDQLDRECAAIGIDHCALGGWFGEHSQLPDTLIQTIRFHHEPDWAENSERLVNLIAAADHMANYLQRGGDVNAYHLESNHGLALLAARWPQARKERLLGNLPVLMNEALQAAACAHLAN